MSHFGKMKEGENTLFFRYEEIKKKNPKCFSLGVL